jgi:hypothetical protein
MSTETILENEYVTLVYHANTKIVHHTFHKTAHGDKFRDTLNTGLEIFKKYGAHKWLSDDRQNSTLPDDDTVWAKTEWFPHVLEAGWQYWAIVWPQQTLAIMNLKEFMDTYRPFGLQVMAFKDPKPAMSWLVNNKVVAKIKPVLSR